MAGTDILGALLKSVGTGVRQYGGELSARDQEKQQMAKTLKMQRLKDTVQAERDLAVLRNTNPRLASKVEQLYAEAGQVFPLDEAHMKQFSTQLSAEDAKQQLEAQQGQMAAEQPMGNLARQSGVDSPLGVTPQTPEQKYEHQMDWSTFGGPSLSEAQGNAASVPTRGRMSTPYDTFQEAAKIYVQKRRAAENERVKLSATNQNTINKLTAPTKRDIEIADARARIKAGVQKAPSDTSESEMADLKKEWRGIVRQINMYNSRLKSYSGAWDRMPQDMKDLRLQMDALTGKRSAPGDPIPMLSFEDYVKMTDPGTGEDELDAVLRGRGL